jgi:hypothetical protein
MVESKAVESNFVAAKKTTRRRETTIVGFFQLLWLLAEMIFCSRTFTIVFTTINAILMLFAFFRGTINPLWIPACTLILVYLAIGTGVVYYKIKEVRRKSKPTRANPLP